MALNVITRTEAKVVRALPEFDGVLLYELARPTQLMPTEVGRVVDRLVEKGVAEFAEFIEGSRIIRLTDEGRRLRRRLERGGYKQRSWGTPSDDVRIVPDEESTKLADEDDDVGVTRQGAPEDSRCLDIDSALDEEISSRSRRDVATRA